MRREDDVSGHAARGFVDVDAFARHALADQLERGKGAVALVQMHDAGRDVERRKCPRTADAEHQFLPDAHPLVAAVEA